jgi:ADP-ribose pyrophosphatase
VTEEQLFRIADSNLLLDLGFFSVTQRSIESSNGALFNRYVVEHPGAVAVVPLIDGDVVLVRQYRAAIGDYILEIPAGRLDVLGEDPEAAARRELREETGFVANDFTHLTDLLTAVGFCDERIGIFMAENVEAGVRAPVGPEEHDAEVLRLPFEDAVDLVTSGEISDAKTAIGLLLAAKNRDAS